MAPTDGAKAGTIAGICVGLAALAVIACFSIFVPLRKRSLERKTDENNKDAGDGEASRTDDPGDAELGIVSPVRAEEGTKDANGMEDRSRAVSEAETRPGSREREAESSQVPVIEGRPVVNEAEVNNSDTGFKAEMSVAYPMVSELEPTTLRRNELSADSTSFSSSSTNSEPDTPTQNNSTSQSRNKTAFSSSSSEPEPVLMSPKPIAVPNGSSISDAEYERNFTDLQRRHDQLQARRETLLQLQLVQEEEDRLREQMDTLEQGRGKNHESFSSWEKKAYLVSHA